MFARGIATASRQETTGRNCGFTLRFGKPQAGLLVPWRALSALCILKLDLGEKIEGVCALVGDFSVQLVGCRIDGAIGRPSLRING
jgi:hypothetical protein